MNYAALTGTVDAFEAVLFLLLLIAWGFAARNVREGWTEKEWALDDPSPVMRRLGAVRYDNARLLTVVVFCVTVVDLLIMLTPSAIQTQEGTTEVLVSVGSRAALIVATLALIHKVWNDSWWRRYSDAHDGRRPPVVAAAAAPVVVAEPAPGKD
jgi:hypothetical protein